MVPHQQHRVVVGRRRAVKVMAAKAGEEEAGMRVTRRELATKTVTLAAALAAMPADKRAKAEGSAESSFWEQVELPLEPGVILLDIAFTGAIVSMGFCLGRGRRCLRRRMAVRRGTRGT